MSSFFRFMIVLPLYLLGIYEELGGHTPPTELKDPNANEVEEVEDDTDFINLNEVVSDTVAQMRGLEVDEVAEKKMMEALSK